MILTIGLMPAFVALFIAISSVVSANAKSTAMTRVFGYSGRRCAAAVSFITIYEAVMLFYARKIGRTPIKK